jgi:hypothetical protein
MAMGKSVIVANRGMLPELVDVLGNDDRDFIQEFVRGW